MAAASGKSCVVVLMLACAIILAATPTAEAHFTDCVFRCNEECLHGPAYRTAANCKADCSTACNALVEATKVVEQIVADKKLHHH